jgi:hypothetical protein
VLRSNSNIYSKKKCESALAAAGFSLSHASQRDNPEAIKLKLDQQWIQLITNSPQGTSDPLKTLMGRPGLWKLTAGSDCRPRKVFEFPLFILSDHHPDVETVYAETKSPLSAALRWAKSTLSGRRIDEWRSPSKQETMDLISSQSLTVQCGAYARQGELICRPKRLALRFPLILQVPDDLPDPNYYWLRKLLVDAQNRWKLVRIGFRGESSTISAQAEIDLTGTPHSVLAGLLAISLSVLQAVTIWVVPPAEFLVKHAKDISALTIHNQPKSGTCTNMRKAQQYERR